MATPHLILGLVLRDSKNTALKVGAPFVAIGGEELPALIEAIWYRPESTLTYFEEDDEDLPPPSPETPAVEGAALAAAEEPEPEPDGVEVGHVTPAYYEVWAMPKQGSKMEQANAMVCRKVPWDAVLFVDEGWPLDYAVVEARKRLSIKQEEETEAPAVAAT